MHVLGAVGGRVGEALPTRRAVGERISHKTSNRNAYQLLGYAYVFVCTPTTNPKRISINYSSDIHVLYHSFRSWNRIIRNYSRKINNCNNLSPSRCKFKRFPGPLGQGGKLVEFISVARVRPRTSKGITDLLLPQTSLRLGVKVPLRSKIRFRRNVLLFSRLRSRSLTELTRQITPPTKNGHAPPPIESRKSYQSVNPYYVWTW